MNTHNTTVRVFREIEEPFERGGVYDARKTVDATDINASVTFLTVEQSQIESYNKAIEDAIEVVKDRIGFFFPASAESIIIKLQQLKKQP